MSYDIQIQELINAGAHQDIYLYPDRFTSCPYGQQAFSKQNKPLILNCGHCICRKCLDEIGRCMYPQCNNQKPTVKNESINLKNQIINQQSIFKFAINSFGSQQVVQMELKGSQTFEQLTKNKILQSFINKFGQAQTILIIGSKSRKYSLVKNKRIIDLQKQLRLWSTKKRKTLIRVLIDEFYHGGSNCHSSIFYWKKTFNKPMFLNKDEKHKAQINNYYNKKSLNQPNLKRKNKKQRKQINNFLNNKSLNHTIYFVQNQKPVIQINNFHSKKSLNQGLPNIGNTCFLNSAIQFLYSSKKFRKSLQKKKFQPHSFEDSIVEIFECVQKQKSYNQKIQLMTKIARNLRQINQDYSEYSQQDCFNFILLILDHIGQNYPDLLQLFSLHYNYVCNRCQNTIEIQQYIILNQFINCQKCTGKMIIQFISSPNCIIIRDSEDLSKIISFRQDSKQNIHCQLRAKVIYQGDGECGHYKVSRKNDDDNDIFYLYSDTYVSQQRINSGKFLLFLYESIHEAEKFQKVNKNPVTNIQRQQSQNQQIEFMNRNIRRNT